MKNIFGSYVGGRGALGLLVVRLVFGLGLVLHGLPKVGTPFNWMGPHAPVPGFLQALSVLAEVGGGAALIVGLLTPLAALGVIINFLVAVFMVHVKSGHPFIGEHGKPSYESAAGYLAVGLLALLTGPGALSLDALIFGKKSR